MERLTPSLRELFTPAPPDRLTSESIQPPCAGAWAHGPSPGPGRNRSARPGRLGPELGPGAHVTAGFQPYAHARQGNGRASERG
ncbi:hypothetical protein GCM10010518_24220 [Kitasatospora cinereorecta]